MRRALRRWRQRRAVRRLCSMVLVVLVASALCLGWYLETYLPSTEPGSHAHPIAVDMCGVDQPVKCAKAIVIPVADCPTGLTCVGETTYSPAIERGSDGKWYQHVPVGGAWSYRSDGHTSINQFLAMYRSYIGNVPRRLLCVTPNQLADHNEYQPPTDDTPVQAGAYIVLCP